MIAPTNCCPDCDCAQRMVRCQRAAPVRAWPTDDDLVRQAQDSVTRRNVFLNPQMECSQEHLNEDKTLYRADAPVDDVNKYEAETVAIVCDRFGVEPPPMVIPASLAKETPEEIFEKRKTFLDDLWELEKEFPADMGIAPLPEDSMVQQREFTPEENAAFDAADAKMSVEIAPGIVATAKYPGIVRNSDMEMHLMIYVKGELRDRLTRAFRASETDLWEWDDKAPEKLADIAIATLEKS